MNSSKEALIKSTRADGEILVRPKVPKLWEYFVYFPILALHGWGQKARRSADLFPHPCGSKTGNTYSIPPFSEPSAGEKSLAASSCRIIQSLFEKTAMHPAFGSSRTFVCTGSSRRTRTADTSRPMSESDIGCWRTDGGSGSSWTNCEQISDTS